MMSSKLTQYQLPGRSANALVSPDLDEGVVELDRVRIRVIVIRVLGQGVRLELSHLLFHDDVWRSMPSADKDGLRRIPPVSTLPAAAFNAVQPDLLGLEF